MTLQPFFDEVPKIRVHDPLALLLDCAKDGALEYGFGDAVRVAGHACPTVASAYWLTYLALEHLYPDTLPRRGEILVEFRDDARSGSNGVMATVVQMLTGAAGGSGFKGIAGRFGRAGLIRYKPDLLTLLRFTRLDTQDAVDAHVDMTHVPIEPAMELLLERCAAARATVEEERELGRMWQRRVRYLLLDCARDSAVFTLRPVKRLSAAGAMAS
jgi:formylmethanofuran dehydrogenase subunit E